MGTRIKIKAGEVALEAELNDSGTAKKVADEMPIEGAVSTWGDEIYFAIPVDESLDETAREIVEVGDIGYWPAGSAFCIFFGPTPISVAGEVRPASAVNIIGKVNGDPMVLKSVRDGDTITLQKV
ncbi:MAG: cyclophilin-like fold protein [Candidatus Tritonobacter lacicola]|nr:cyclophilin-like fold protein [Candidatus Tritonobacter lacicola]